MVKFYYISCTITAFVIVYIICLKLMSFYIFFKYKMFWNKYDYLYSTHSLLNDISQNDKLKYIVLKFANHSVGKLMFISTGLFS